MAGKPVILIAGPSAGGKSALALEVALALGGWIVNADSMQIYSELSILTARPGIEAEAAVPHRLYGVVSGKERFSVGAWLARAEAEISAAWAARAVPIVVGGTGLYFEALTQGLAVIPQVPVDICEKWRRFAAASRPETLYAELEVQDPQMAQKLSPGDSQRIVRALEVIDATGRSLAEWQRDTPRPPLISAAAVRRIVVAPDRQAIYARTDARVGEMVDRGAIAEVGALLALNLIPDAPVMKAIGVPELGAHLRGELELGDALEQMRTQTRRYAKRQLTWIRGRMADWHHVGSHAQGLARLCPDIRT
ncbi:tRNA dimethylallyltransferase [hydrothermal vent metagenome]|uniref:tRNA dimethylallyltransferase n=1 Tax=hydrothermal vent metagenome TaxID=652676 RepID=A0A3B0U8I9_9ZZZZ